MRARLASEKKKRGEEKWAACAPLAQSASRSPSQPAEPSSRAGLPSCEPEPASLSPNHQTKPTCKPQAEPPTRVSRTLMGRQLAFRPVSPCNLFPFSFSGLT